MHCMYRTFCQRGKVVVLWFWGYVLLILLLPVSCGHNFLIAEMMMAREMGLGT